MANESAPWIREAARAIAKAQQEYDHASFPLKQQETCEIIADEYEKSGIAAHVPPAEVITLDFEREVDGRWIAEFHHSPGCLAYGATMGEAAQNAINLLNTEAHVPPAGTDRLDLVAAAEVAAQNVMDEQYHSDYYRKHKSLYWPGTERIKQAVMEAFASVKSVQTR